MRKAIGKRLRFEIFDRDQFTCQYCGKAPPEVKLHIDHILPVSKGGGNDPENLRTSCSVCNLGKTDKLMGGVANDKDSRRRAQEALEAVDTAKVFAKAKKARDMLRDMVGGFACECLGSKDCLNSTVTSLFQAFNSHNPPDVMKWFETAASVTSKHGQPNEISAMKYFHGILRRIRERGEQ